MATEARGNRVVWFITFQVGAILASLIAVRPALWPFTVRAPLAAAGVFVDVVSPTSIAQGMRTMLQDADLLDTLARAGRERVLKEYWLEEVAGKFESVLENARREQTR